MVSLNREIFSPWCPKCLAGDYRDGVTGSHGRHGEEFRKERAARRPKLTWSWKIDERT